MLHKTVLKKLNMKNIEWDVYVNVTYDCSQSECEKVKNIEWGRCLCKNVTYHCSESEYEKHWVR
jgi:hypothetical protein